MRRSTIIMTSMLAMALAGCKSTTKPEPKVVNTRIVQSISDMGVSNAIIRQQTMYPYHFVTNGVALNELGKRELGVLAGHYKENPGTLNVRKGGVREELYAARVRAVMDALSAAGVQADRVSIGDGMPGGDGMPSEQVLMVIKERNSPSQPLYLNNKGGNSTGINIEVGK